MISDTLAQVILWAYPLSLITVILCLRLYFHFTKRDQNVAAKEEQRASHRALFWQQSVLSALLLASCIVHFLFFRDALAEQSRTAVNQAMLSSTLAVLFFFLAGLAPDPDEPFRAHISNAYSWATACIFEVLNVALIFSPHMNSPGTLASLYKVASALSTARVAILVLMLVTYWYLSRRLDLEGDEEESEGLLGAEHQNGHVNGNGGNMNGHYGSTKSPKQKQKSKVFDPQSSTWLNYIAGFKKLFPFIWPTGDIKMQAVAVFCFVILAAQRGINVLVPYQLGNLVEAMGSGRVPYKEIALYILYRGLQGQQGVLGSIRALLWIPIQQSTYKRLTTAAYEHVLSLSLDFHLSKRIGEVMSALNKGSALNTFLDGFAFQLFPMVLDLFVAAVFFFIKFDAFYSLIVVAIMWAYIFVTIYMAKYRGRARRTMANRDREMDAAKTDAIMAYETVHQNGAVPAEKTKFERLVYSFQNAEWSVLASLNFLNAAQNIIFVLGILIVCLLSAYEISIDIQKVSTFVALLAYFTQLQAPLNFFGSFYTQVQNNLVDAERMISLFDEQPQVVDLPTARPILSCRGKITFVNVDFAYDERRQALQDVSFTVEPGTTTAIVGESGSGKSTCLKLLFRFYEANGGKILVDDQDVRDITVESLRENIGVVPQDTVLFNETLLYNVQYANPQASIDDVYGACARASIHDRIMSFPDQYDTSVGERGLRLSGGEKQRVSIARAILKRAQIMLLDEATASLDSQTEKEIQSSLEEATENRTTITIAHRLSTITKSDQIIVMHRGRIVERGTHVELLAMKGRYAHMWDKQTTAEEKEESRNPNHKGTK